MQVPASLAALLASGCIEALDAAVAPPTSLRPTKTLTLELEVEGEGTFTLTLQGGRVTGKKGFADEPFASARIPRGGFKRVQKILQTALDGLPPEIEKRRRDAIALLHPGDLDAVAAKVEKLKAQAFAIDVGGEGRFAIARGALDEADKTVVVSVSAADVDAVLAGAPLSAARVTVGGDKSVLASLMTALGPLAKVLQA